MTRLHLVSRATDRPLSPEERLSLYYSKRVFVPELSDVSATPLERALHGLRVAVDGFQMPEWTL